ncbi:hypothetical protein K0M31_002193 [Melipona bicolor]|uniref:Uncharacterized protein n=1 Tax=Melipona bicolor TaxID=60889 RepID=A0AA40GH63_9HYME|nr:hypothetical protein K0M31_002193 [Melipona bicolor]
MLRRFLLLQCPGNGYGGGLALTAASLGAGVAERGRFARGPKGERLSRSIPHRAGPVRTGATATSNRDAWRLTKWMKEGAGWTEMSAAKGAREQADLVGATASKIGV